MENFMPFSAFDGESVYPQKLSPYLAPVTV